MKVLIRIRKGIKSEGNIFFYSGEFRPTLYMLYIVYKMYFIHVIVIAILSNEFVTAKDKCPNES